MDAKDGMTMISAFKDLRVREACHERNNLAWKSSLKTHERSTSSVPRAEVHFVYGSRWHQHTRPAPETGASDSGRSIGERWEIQLGHFLTLIAVHEKRTVPFLDFRAPRSDLGKKYVPPVGDNVGTPPN